MKNSIHLKLTLCILILGFFVFTSWNLIEDNSSVSVPITFTIKKIKNQEDKGTMKMLFDLRVDEDDFYSFTGKGALSMCNCYCDSLWDAWPSGIDNIPGTGTLHFFSSGGGSQPELEGIQTGVLGIREVEGGIDRNTDFNVSINFLVDE